MVRMPPNETIGYTKNNEWPAVKSERTVVKMPPNETKNEEE